MLLLYYNQNQLWIVVWTSDAPSGKNPSMSIEMLSPSEHKHLLSHSVSSFERAPSEHVLRSITSLDPPLQHFNGHIDIIQQCSNNGILVQYKITFFLQEH